MPIFKKGSGWELGNYGQASLTSIPGILVDNVIKLKTI